MKEFLCEHCHKPVSYRTKYHYEVIMRGFVYSDGTIQTDTSEFVIDLCKECYQKFIKMAKNQPL